MTFSQQIKSQAERDTFITEHLPLVGREVKKFLQRNPTFGYLKDDLSSAATVGLVQAVNTATTTDPKHLYGYVIRSIQREIKALIDLEETIRVPTRTKLLAKKNGSKVHNVKCGRLVAEPLIDPHPFVETVDHLLGVCCDDRERRVIEMRFARYTLAEIGKAIGLDRTRVCHILRSIRERFYSDSQSVHRH